jgi:sirohydrochlorin cobaltochelatase
MQNLTQTLADWLAAGGTEIGEIHLRPAEPGHVLCHRHDTARTDLTVFDDVETARELAHFDDAGRYRPLKTAPNLRRGWQLTVTSLGELRQAFDYFYPAMLGIWRSHQRGTLTAVPLRETLNRQTGMYRVTQKITDTQAAALITNFCAGCLKRRLWTIAGTSDPGPLTPVPSLPLLCHEACNLLVAEARRVVKKAELPS